MTAARTLVRRAIESREILFSDNPLEDARFLSRESVKALGSSAVIVAPLHVPCRSG